MKKFLLICMVLAGLAGCMSSSEKSLNTLGKEACKTATACCRSIHLTKALPVVADAASAENTTIEQETPVLYLQWNIEILSR